MILEDDDELADLPLVEHPRLDHEIDHVAVAIAVDPDRRLGGRGAAVFAFCSAVRRSDAQLLVDQTEHVQARGPAGRIEERRQPGRELDHVELLVDHQIGRRVALEHDLVGPLARVTAPAPGFAAADAARPARRAEVSAGKVGRGTARAIRER